VLENGFQKENTKDTEERIDKVIKISEEYYADRK